MSKPELWICPKCGNRFVTANLSHSCGQFSIDALFARSEQNVRAAFDALEAMIRSMADVIVIPQKTRVVFQTRTRFCGGTPKRDWFDASFIFLRPLEHPRFYKINDYAGKWFGHHVKLAAPEDVNDDVEAWVREALIYGNQEQRATKSAPAPGLT